MKTPAVWITCPGLPREDAAFLARRELVLDDVPAAASLRIAADCRYVLWVNGEEVGIGPARGGHRRYFYDTHEVGRLLKRGRNHLAVEVYSPGRPTFSAVPAATALWVEGEGVAGTDEAWQVVPDPSRRPGAPFYTPQIGFSEWRDLRRERAGWATFSDAEDGWLAPVVLSGTPGGRDMAARDVPLLVGETHAPDRLVFSGRAGGGDGDDAAYPERMQAEAHVPEPGVATLRDGEIFFVPVEEGAACAIVDFGREVSGTLRLDVEAEEGTILDLGYGDALFDGRVKTFQEPYRFADRYVLRAGRQRITHGVHDRGFRFLQMVARRAGGPARVGIRITDRLCPLPFRAAFACDDPFLDRLWKMCGTTLATCAADTFVDCPWREQAFWVNDTLVVYPYYLGYTGDAVLPARCLRLAAAGQRKDGAIPSVYPSAPGRDSTFPSMAAIWTLMLADYHLYTGDAALVRELLPTMDSALATYDAWADPDGLVPNQPGMWNFIEWGFPGSRHDAPESGTTVVLNLLIAAARRAAGGLHEAAGDRQRAALYREKEKRGVAAAIARFWIPERSRFRDAMPGPETSSQHPHALGLHYGLLPETHREAAIAALRDPGLAQADFYFRHFVLDALARGDREAEALDSIRKLWGPMVAAGSPTVWETSRGQDEFDGVGSLCHAFACAPLHFMQAVLLGVRPLSPGFATFSLAPRGAGLRRARGTVPTPHGPISVAWEREGAALRVEAEVPPGTEAVLPGGKRLPSGRHLFSL